MSEKKEKTSVCSCSISTSGYGSSVHYHICSRCTGGAARFLDYLRGEPTVVAQALYRSSMTRTERLNRERQELIRGVRISADLLKPEFSADISDSETEERFRMRMRADIKRDVAKIRAISREIGPVRPVVSGKK